MDTEVSMINNVIGMANSNEPYKKSGIGARLKSARESMHLTEKEAAARLYLNVKLITVMESENFADGPPATFIRGYLHSYARLLDFPESEINVALKELETSLPINNQTAVSQSNVKQNPIDLSERYIRFATLGVGVVLFLLVAIWWHSHSSDDVSTDPISVPEATTTVPAVVQEPAPVTPPIEQTVDQKLPQPQPAATMPSKSEEVKQSTPTVTASAVEASAGANTETPIIPLALSAQPVSSKKSKSTRHSEGTHSTRHPKIQNVVMSLPEPGSQ